jgi:hypothetical protein
MTLLEASHWKCVPRNYLTAPINSTVTSGKRRASNFCLSAASSEKYTKSLTNKPRVSSDDEGESLGLEGSNTWPVKRH